MSGSALTVTDQLRNSTGSSKVAPVSFSASQGDQFNERLSMQNPVAQLKMNLTPHSCDDVNGGGPHVQYNIVGVQDLSFESTERQRKRKAANMSSGSSQQVNILIENNEMSNFSGRKPKLFPTIEELGQIGKIKLPSLKTPQNYNGSAQNALNNSIGSQKFPNLSTIQEQQQNSRMNATGGFKNPYNSSMKRHVINSQQTRYTIQNLPRPPKHEKKPSVQKFKHSVEKQSFIPNDSANLTPKPYDAMFDFKRKISGERKYNYTSVQEDMERKVQKLSYKTQLLSKKVTGVNFYLQDVASLSKVKANPPQIISKTVSQTIKATPTKSIQFLTRDSFASSSLEKDFSQTRSTHLYTPNSGHPQILVKKIYQANIKELMPHPPKDLMNLDATNFVPNKSYALVSLERNMNEINYGLQKAGNYKKFFWTPDMSVCGFGTNHQIQKTLNNLHVDLDYTDKFRTHYYERP